MGALAACVPSPFMIQTPTPSPEKIAYAVPTDTRLPPTPNLNITLTPTIDRARPNSPRQTFPTFTRTRDTNTRAQTLANNSVATITAPSNSNVPVNPTSPRTKTFTPIAIQATATRTATLLAPSPTRPNLAIVPTALAPTISASNESYSTLQVFSEPTNPPAVNHPDLNLSLRGYSPTNATLSLVDYSGAGGSGAPQLFGLFADNRTPAFTSAYLIYDWNWSCNCRGGLNNDWDVLLLGMRTSVGENIFTPDSGADIGNDFRALVLFADATRVTLKYTREDNVVNGYTLHLENISVDANLLALYQQRDAAGRADLPALRARQAIGRASGNEILVAIRDAGSFLDPRSRKDWWRGR